VAIGTNGENSFLLITLTGNNGSGQPASIPASPGQHCSRHALFNAEFASIAYESPRTARR
jgi:hypothetical protein